MVAVAGAVTDSAPNTMYRFVVGIWSWTGVPSINVPEPETAVSDCVDTPKGDSIVDDGVRIVTTFSVPRPNNVACDIVLYYLAEIAFSLNNSSILGFNEQI